MYFLSFLLPSLPAALLTQFSSKHVAIGVVEIKVVAVEIKFVAVEIKLVVAVEIKLVVAVEIKVVAAEIKVGVVVFRDVVGVVSTDFSVVPELSSLSLTSFAKKTAITTIPIIKITIRTTASFSRLSFEPVLTCVLS